MARFAKPSWIKAFSHVYVEEAARHHPLTTSILRRFPDAITVGIGNYKEVLNRAGQHFQTQKQSMNLILAVKRNPFIYRGSIRSQDFGHTNFFYTNPVLNCIYNCDYCYLQGMYPSSNLVVFVNTPDFLQAAQQAVADRQNKDEPLFLSISYDTDLLAFEKVAPYCGEWIRFARQEPDLLVEIRTKSANYRSIKQYSPLDRVILAWTLSPTEVVQKYERGTPGLNQRLSAVKDAMDDGWRVRLCFDPVLHFQGWENIYVRFIQHVARRLAVEKVHDISLGVFRISSQFFRLMKKQREDTDILYHSYEHTNGNVSYPPALRREMIEKLEQEIGCYFPGKKVETWV